MGKNWDAVADAINTRMDELQMTQQELAHASSVSPATLRELQHNRNPRKRSSRLLSAISVALDWPSSHLEYVADGSAPAEDADRLSQLEAAVVDLQERVQKLEDRR